MEASGIVMERVLVVGPKDTLAMVDDLAPNRTTEFSATGRSTQDLANSGATCVVQKIDATPA